MIRTKRVYQPPSPTDGRRYLVDRLWPRGLRKEELAIDAWVKDLGPSHQLRRWFAHEPNRWEDFKRRYAEELLEKTPLWRPLLAQSERATVTLVFSARDEAHNQAVALAEFLRGRRAKLTRKK